MEEFSSSGACARMENKSYPPIRYDMHEVAKKKYSTIIK
jgi:hypothetical protein